MRVLSSTLSGASVSVVIPAYNASATIGNAIRSVLDQTAAPGEIIVVDDGSSDDTAEQVRKFGARVHFMQQANAGAAAARNRGAADATGELLAFLDADDQWHVEKTARQLEVFSAHPDVAICRTRFRMIPVGQAYDSRSHLERRAVRVESNFPKVFVDPYFGTPTVMMRRATFLECRGFDETLETAEDVDLWLRASYRRVVATLDEPLVCVTTSPTSLTARTGGRTDPDNLRVIDAFVAKYPEFGQRHARVVRRARAIVLTRMGSGALARREIGEARRLLRASLSQDPLSSRTIYLLLRSLTIR